MKSNAQNKDYQLDGNSPLSKNIDSYDQICKEIDSFGQKQQNNNQKNNSKPLQDRTNQSENQGQNQGIIDDDSFQEGQRKIQELGETIRNSLCSIQLKFSETKSTIEKVTRNNKNWDEKLAVFYDQLFSSAKNALFQPPQKIQSENQTSNKPQSCLKFQQNTNNSKQLSNKNTHLQPIPMKKPSSVQKISAFQMNFGSNGNSISLKAKPASTDKFLSIQSHNRGQPMFNQNNKTQSKPSSTMKFGTSSSSLLQSQNSIQNQISLLNKSKAIKKDPKQTVTKIQNKK